MIGIFKILVISDTHKNISNAVEIIENKKPDYVLHLGDLSADADEIRYIYPRLEIIGVSGNCDWLSVNNAPLERMLDIGGVKILMCHGHTYSVKNGVGAYTAVVEAKNADIGLFGHTHIPYCENKGEFTLLNPGTVSAYGWIEVCDGEFDCKIYSVGE